MSAGAPALIATGSALPEQIRTNDDPIFDWLHEHAPAGSDLFSGYTDRRVLGPGETVGSIMVQAAAAALNAGKIAAGQIDMLLGYGSVGEYITPNTLAHVHAELGLGSGVEVLPLANDFTNWNSAVVIADALIRAGRINCALIVCGANWTQYVDYHTPQAISAADGAGATVVAPATGPDQWRLVDRQHFTGSQYYGDMYMAGDPLSQGGFSSPVMHITAQGLKAFGAVGEQAAVGVVQALLARNQLNAALVTLIGHQASQVLFDYWQQQLPQITMLSTLPQYANLELAAIPVNLDQLGASITTDYLVTLGLGEQLHAGALLFTRGAA